MSFEHIFQQAIHSGHPPSPSYLFAMMGFMALNPDETREGLSKISSGELACASQSGKTIVDMQPQKFEWAAHFNNPFISIISQDYCPLVAVHSKYLRKGYENYSGLIYWLFGGMLDAGDLVQHSYSGADTSRLSSSSHYAHAAQHFGMPLGVSKAWDILRSLCQIHSLTEGAAIPVIAHIDQVEVFLRQASQLFRRYPTSNLCAYVYLLLADLPSAKMSLWKEGIIDRRKEATAMLSEFDQECLELFRDIMQGARERFFQGAIRLKNRPGRDLGIQNLIKLCAFLVPSI